MRPLPTSSTRAACCNAPSCSRHPRLAEPGATARRGGAAAPAHPGGAAGGLVEGAAGSGAASGARARRRPAPRPAPPPAAPGGAGRPAARPEARPQQRRLVLGLRLLVGGGLRAAALSAAALAGAARHVENSRPEASASSPYCTPRQRQIKPRPALGLGLSQSADMLWLAGHTAVAFHTGAAPRDGGASLAAARGAARARRGRAAREGAAPCAAAHGGARGRGAATLLLHPAAREASEQRLTPAGAASNRHCLPPPRHTYLLPLPTSHYPPPPTTAPTTSHYPPPPTT